MGIWNNLLMAIGVTIPVRFVVDRGTFVRGLDPNRVVRATGQVSPHWGIDIAAPVGTPVHAVMGGNVILSRAVTGYGNAIGISHDDGRTSSFYGHLSAQHVREGQHVSAQEVIGLTGTTAVGPSLRFENGVPVSGPAATGGNVGASVGPHLHMEISPTPIPMLGRAPRRLDPVAWLSQQGVGQFAQRWRPQGTVDMPVA
jgi:murein DD-endopeptidase MepM/ murein hydrolase activator NlpD